MHWLGKISCESHMSSVIFTWSSKISCIFWKCIRCAQSKKYQMASQIKKGIIQNCTPCFWHSHHYLKLGKMLARWQSDSLVKNMCWLQNQEVLFFHQFVLTIVYILFHSGTFLPKAEMVKLFGMGSLGSFVQIKQRKLALFLTINNS